jgi:hypothetical protein
MILFSGNLAAPITGAGFQTAATVPIPAGLLLDGVLRWSISGRRTTGAGTCQQRVRIGGVDLLTFAAADTNAVIFTRGNAFAETLGSPASLRSNAASSRGGAVLSTGLAAVDLTALQDLTFEIDLATDTDVYTFDDLTVEYLPPV